MPSEGDPGGDGVGGFRTGTDAFALGYYEGDYKPVNAEIISVNQHNLPIGRQVCGKQNVILLVSNTTLDDHHKINKFRQFLKKQLLV